MAPILIPDGEVRVGRGLLDTDPVLPERPTRRMVALLTQPGALPYAQRLEHRLRETGLDLHLRVLPDRDEAKRLRVVGEVYEWLGELAVGRHDTIVGVGGGAVTDLAGFVAATWLRGIECVHVPTTLLAAVDAAIGGKTGINVRGKNLVGAFWNPRAVVIDLDVVDQLPPVVRREGLAEALKAGLIADPLLVELFERHGAAAPLDEVVPRAVQVKADVVREDPREMGRRAILNYGHTIGHAVEMVAGISHGEAVAVGMVAAGRASAVRLGFDGEALQTELISVLGLPTRSPQVDGNEVRRLLQLDKKRDAGGLRMVLLRGVGNPEVIHVDLALVDQALASVGIN